MNVGRHQPVQPYTPRFLCDQAQRTAPTRQFFYQQTIWKDAPICLDIGCGAGVITPELADKIPHSTVIGFDIDQNLLVEAVSNHRNDQAVHFMIADCTALPFRAKITDFALSHFTLMWIPNRMNALTEIYDTLLSQGVLACIEPDYAGRIEIHEGDPPVKAKPPYQIVTTLTRLGADPFTGGHLSGELAKLNFHNIQFGVLSWTFNPQAIEAEIHSEAALLHEKGVEWAFPAFIYTPIFWILATKLP